MSSQGEFSVRRGGGARSALKKLVMAWARDVITGEPRYILEIDKAHRGGKCGCECPSCGEPLTAVNAAKTEFVIRPHFRHPDGVDRDECLVLTARAAALRQLTEDGWIDLPLRRMPATARGLSGENYDAWVDRPAQRVRLRHADFLDPTQAVLTLDDGRVVHVVLTGAPGDETGTSSEGGLSVPTIYIDIDDPSLVDMAPDELRKRLKLLPDSLCWSSHWQDDELHLQALAKARAKALFYLDEVPDELELPEGLEPGLRRESVLHYEVKRILDERKLLVVPAIEVEVVVPVSRGRDLVDSWSEPVRALALEQVRLERRFDRIVPDVTCQAQSVDGRRHYSPLLIEVTVSNVIDDARLERIRQAGQAALEIDFSRTGGRLTRDELARVVVEDLETKRWLFNPLEESCRGSLQRSLQEQATRERAELSEIARCKEERLAKVLATPKDEIAKEYLEGVLALNDARVLEDVHGRLLPHAVEIERLALERVADAADKLAIRGYPEASDELLVGRHGILARILSCKLGRPVGYRLANVMGVLNAVRQSKGNRRSFHSLLMIAVAVYKPELTAEQRKWYEEWREEVRSSIRNDQTEYLRSPVFDRLLGLLFPEMAELLERPKGKLTDELKWDPERKVFFKPDVPRRGAAEFLKVQPLVGSLTGQLVDTAPSDWWLKGRDLEAWRKANPERAMDWFVSKKGNR